MDHVPGNTLRVFYVRGYRVKQVSALDLSNVTNEICWLVDYLNIFHDEILLAGEVKDFLQLDDVGMVYGRQDRDFTLNHVLFPLTFCLHQTEWITGGRRSKDEKVGEIF